MRALAAGGGGRRAGGGRAADGGDAGVAEGGAGLRARRCRGPACAPRPGRTGFCCRSSATGALDLVVGRLAAPDEMAGLVFEQLYSEAVVAVVRAGHPLLAARRRPRRLSADPAAAGRDHPAGGGAALPPHRAGAAAAAGRDGVAGAGRGLVLASDAVWFISAGVVAEEIAAGTLVALDLGGMARAGPVGLTLRSGQEPSTRCAADAGAARGVLRELRRRWPHPAPARAAGAARTRGWALRQSRRSLARTRHPPAKRERPDRGRPRSGRPGQLW